jgi:hypothetical protein
MDLTQRVWPAAHAHNVLEATLNLAALKGSLSEWTGLLSQAPKLG